MEICQISICLFKRFNEQPIIGIASSQTTLRYRVDFVLSPNLEGTMSQLISTVHLGKFTYVDIGLPDHHEGQSHVRRQRKADSGRPSFLSAGYQGLCVLRARRMYDRSRSKIEIAALYTALLLAQCAHCSSLTLLLRFVK